MKVHIRHFFLVAFATILFQGCEEAVNDIIPEEPSGTTSLTVTGALSKSISHQEVEFQSSAVQEQKVSGLDLYIGNIGTTETLVRITLADLDNGELFGVGTYNVSTDVNSTFNLVATYLDEDGNNYSINLVDPGVNKLVITEVKNSIDNAVLKGEIELNLQDGSGTMDMIKITGTFEAVGTAIQL